MPAVKQAVREAAALHIIPERLDYLEKWLQDFYRDGHIRHLVVKIQRYGQVLFEGAYGGDGRGGPLTADTIYPVASITKPVISTLLHILQEDGLLDIAEPAGYFLPMIQQHPDKAAMTFMQLLTHTSGMTDEDLHKGVDEYIKNELEIPLPEDGDDRAAWDAVMDRAHAALELSDEERNRTWFHIAMRLPNTHPPRKFMSYCNTGFQMLKHAVDAITKEPIDDFASRRLFGPLKMSNTHFVLPEEKWPLVVYREEGCDGYPYQNSPDCFKSQSGAGGLKTTANDILRFAEMIRCGGTYDGARVLSPVTVRSMTKNQNTELSAYDSWALGFNLRCGKYDDCGSSRSDSSMDHGGWGGTFFALDPENGIPAAIFDVSMGRPVPRTIFNRIINIVNSALDDHE